MDSTLAALLGAIIGGLLSVVASWLAQRVQSKSQWRTQEIARRQQLYSEFLNAAVCAYADALQHSQIDTNAVSRLYGEMGRMRLNSSEPVLLESYRLLHKILAAYKDTNRTSSEVGELFSNDAIDLYTDFSDACRAELMQLQPEHQRRDSQLSFRPMPRMTMPNGG